MYAYSPTQSVLITPEDVYMIYSKERFWSKQESRTTVSVVVVHTVIQCHGGLDAYGQLNKINVCTYMYVARIKYFIVKNIIADHVTYSQSHTCHVIELYIA